MATWVKLHHDDIERYFNLDAAVQMFPTDRGTKIHFLLYGTGGMNVVDVSEPLAEVLALARRERNQNA